jgi:hypothetical protein
MIRSKFLSRAEWEHKLRSVNAHPLEGATKLNTAEWWKRVGGAPFPVPVEPNGDADYWAIQRLIIAIGGRSVFRRLFPPEED